MSTDYDFSRTIAKFDADPSARFNFDLTLRWEVLNTFSDDFDGRFVAAARHAGAQIWSEEKSGFRQYHLNGTGAQLAKVTRDLHRDLNQPTSRTFEVSGFNGFVASVHTGVIDRCETDGLGYKLVPYAGRFRSHLVITVKGPLAKVVCAVSDMAYAINRAVGQGTIGPDRPDSPVVPQPAAPAAPNLAGRAVPRGAASKPVTAPGATAPAGDGRAL